MIFDIPILLLTYKRFETTQKIVQILKIIKPAKIYFASNAPNPENINDEFAVSEVRSLINQIDWECEIVPLFRVNHLKVKDSIADSISWFFQNEELGIILEDDCIPNFTFFEYCRNLLLKYKDDNRIGLISGNNFQNGKFLGGDSSYYFSKYAHIWGWATWRRTWKIYQKNIEDWPQIKRNKIFYNLFFNKDERLFWEAKFDSIYFLNFNTWDYQLTYSLWKNGLLSVIPNVNLVSNHGFGATATHTKEIDQFSKMKTTEIRFPLNHPDTFISNYQADIYFGKMHCVKPTLLKRVISKIKSII